MFRYVWHVEDDIDPYLENPLDVGPFKVYVTFSVIFFKKFIAKELIEFFKQYWAFNCVQF